MTLGWHGPTPRQGCLDVRMSDGNQTLCHWTRRSWVLGNERRIVDVLLPPLDIEHDHEQIEITLAWVEGGRRIALGSAPSPLTDAAGAP